MVTFKPDYLGPKYSVRFKDSSLAHSYEFRATYPPETFSILSSLITDNPRRVLDVGCGTGNVARNMVDFTERVDALDFSEAMIKVGRTLPNGNHPKLRWILGTVEKAPLDPPYALITAGQSLHWMDWDLVFERFRKILTPNGFLAIIDTKDQGTPWKDGLQTIMKKFSTNPSYSPFDMIAEWERNNLFIKYGETETSPVDCVQSIEDYIESLHSISSLSRDAMGSENAESFDSEVRDLMSRFTKEDKVEMKLSGSVLWGKPISEIGKNGTTERER